MSVLIETSLGEVVVDLLTDEAPLACKNFLKLCTIKYYHGCLFFNVQEGFMIQTGDPTGTGKGGTSVYGMMYGEQATLFADEIIPTRKHNEKGLLCMANMGVPNSNKCQFFFTLRDDNLEHLDGKHTIFGKVEEGFDVLQKIEEQFVDDDGRPFRDIRILHTHVLDDPYDNPSQLVIPPASPTRDKPEEEKLPPRIGVHEKIGEGDAKSSAELEKSIREKEAKSHAAVLEMIGDVPDADMAPPENVLFICKINPVTTDDDLEIIFSRFGPCKAELCRDHITGDSLNYGFVEFETVEACEEAYRKMNNVLIDDRRIKVDFSQSMSKQWASYRSNTKGLKLKSGQQQQRQQQRHQQMKPPHHQQQQQQQQQQPYRQGQQQQAAGASKPRTSRWGNRPSVSSDGGGGGSKRAMGGEERGTAAGRDGDGRTGQGGGRSGRWGGRDGAAAGAEAVGDTVRAEGRGREPHTHHRADGNGKDRRTSREKEEGRSRERDRGRERYRERSRSRGRSRSKSRSRSSGRRGGENSRDKDRGGERRERKSDKSHRKRSRREEEEEEEEEGSLGDDERRSSSGHKKEKKEKKKEKKEKKKKSHKKERRRSRSRG